jgi:hypothetical protein
MEDIAFCLAGGDGKVGEMAVYCVRSIRQHHPDAPVVVVVPETESVSREYDSLDATVVRAALPVPEYPISAKVNALRVAQAEIAADTYVLLDSDIFVTAPLEPGAFDGDVCALPVIQSKYPWNDAPAEKWLPLYERFDVSPPSEPVVHRDGVGLRFPYFNAGVVITSVTDLGEVWVERTGALFGEIEDDYFSDQVALGLTAAEHDPEGLPLTYNMGVVGKLVAPRRSRILHYYGHYRNLLKAPWWIDSYRDTGIISEFPFSWTDPQIVPFGLKSAAYYCLGEDFV